MGVDRVHKTDYAFCAFDTPEALITAAHTFVIASVSEAIARSGRANLALSGGSTPRPLYERLSQTDLPWSKVSATAVDDRVTDDPAGSNAVMIRNTLMQGPADGLNFTELTAGREYGVFDLSLFGMGKDGHTASWFPGSEDLRAVLNIDTPDDVQNISAAGCPGAGDYPNRVTLSLPAAMNSRSLLLLITGAEKRAVFESAMSQSMFDAPVKALTAAGNRLTVMWAPKG